MLAAYRCRRALPRIRTRDDAWVWSRLNAGLLAVVAALWILLVVHNAWWQRRSAGFDARGHLAYIEQIQSHGGIPLADEGEESSAAALLLAVGSGARATGRSAGDLRPWRRSEPNLPVVLIGCCWSQSLRLIFCSPAARGLILVAAMTLMQLTPHHYPTNRSGRHAGKRLYAALRVCRTRQRARGAMQCSVP
jgi:hypothetical protein